LHHAFAVDAGERLRHADGDGRGCIGRQGRPRRQARCQRRAMVVGQRQRVCFPHARRQPRHARQARHTHEHHAFMLQALDGFGADSLL
jgi:hypothetical protein